MSSCFSCNKYDWWLTLVNSGGTWCMVYGGVTVGAGSIACKEDLMRRWWLCAVVYGGRCV